jgi:hypothetical protein
MNRGEGSSPLKRFMAVHGWGKDASVRGGGQRSVRQ